MGSAPSKDSPCKAKRTVLHPKRAGSDQRVSRNPSPDGAEDADQRNLVHGDGEVGPDKENWGLHFVSSEEAADLMERYSTYIFARADSDGAGALCFEEFLTLAQSATLDLGLDEKQAKRMFKGAASAQNVIKLKQFVPLMRDLMYLHSKKRKHEKNPDWQWFCMYLADSPSALPVYYNTVSNQMTYDRPACIASLGRSEEDVMRDFQQMVRISDGAVFTSFVADDGIRLYLDWDAGDWCVFPAEQESEFIIEASHLYDNDPWVDEYNDTLERFSHPLTKIEYETSSEGGQRLIFDVDTKEWISIPVLLEVYVPSVMRALGLIRQHTPSWTNAFEQILALRLHHYNPEEVIAWWLKDQSFLGQQPGIVEPTAHDEWAFNLDAVLKIYRDQAAARRQGIENSSEYLSLQKTCAEQQRKLADTEAHARRLQERVRELEAQVAAPSSAATVDLAVVQQLEARLQEKHAEVENLKKGSSVQAAMQTSLETKDKALADLQAQLVAITTKRLATTKANHAAIAKLHFESQTLREMTQTIRRMFQMELKPTLLQMMRDTEQSVLTTAGKMVEHATQALVAKYRNEVRQRKLLYNKLQELKGNIRVFCRVRADDRVTCVMQFTDATASDNLGGTPTELVCPNPRDTREKKKFEFDVVYNPSHTQEDVFADTESIITSCVDGYNVCIMAYGQTGSGKTYTMMGTEENMGVNRRAIREILRVCQDRASDYEFDIRVSLLEIYNEKIIDLLSRDSVDKQDCDLRQDPQTRHNYVTNLTTRPVKAIDDIVHALEDGEKNRSTAATKMNSHSSRSHLLLTITVDSLNHLTSVRSQGKLTMVDLAGSERLSKTEATGPRLVEAAAINKSLSALGQVFTSLRTGQSHVPYRNSKLTHLLQDSLGGDSKCAVFVNVSPAATNLAETIGTLNFGTAIRSIELGPSKPTRTIAKSN